MTYHPADEDRNACLTSSHRASVTIVHIFPFAAHYLRAILPFVSAGRQNPPVHQTPQSEDPLLPRSNQKQVPRKSVIPTEAGSIARFRASRIPKLEFQRPGVPVPQPVRGHAPLGDVRSAIRRHAGAVRRPAGPGLFGLLAAPPRPAARVESGTGRSLCPTPHATSGPFPVPARLL